MVLKMPGQEKWGANYRARCPRRFDSSRCFASNSPGSDCRGRCFGLRASRGPKFRKRFFRHYRLDAGVSAVQCLRSNEKPSPQDTLKAGASGQRCLLTSRSASFPAWPPSFLSSSSPASSCRISSNPYPCSCHFLRHSHDLSSRALDVLFPGCRGLRLRGISRAEAHAKLEVSKALQVGIFAPSQRSGGHC